MGFSWTTVAIVLLIRKQQKTLDRKATSLCVSPSEPAQECCWCHFILPRLHYDISASIRMLSEVHERTFPNFSCGTLVVYSKISSLMLLLQAMVTDSKKPAHSTKLPQYAGNEVWMFLTTLSHQIRPTYWLEWEAEKTAWRHECICRFAASTAMHSQLAYRPRQTAWNLFPLLKAINNSVCCVCA